MVNEKAKVVVDHLRKVGADKPVEVQVRFCSKFSSSRSSFASAAMCARVLDQ